MDQLLLELADRVVGRAGELGLADLRELANRIGNRELSAAVGEFLLQAGVTDDVSRERGRGDAGTLRNYVASVQSPKPDGAVGVLSLLLLNAQRSE